MASKPRPAVQLGFQLGMSVGLPQVREKKGVVYTKPWVVELILDLAGYQADTNLVDAVAIEPAAGTGAFLVPMVKRLVASCRGQNRSVLHTAGSLIAYELDGDSADLARRAVMRALIALDVPRSDAEELAHGWIRVGDYLFDAPTLPPADFVIGNPPYIRLEDMDEALASTYRASYRTMKGRADIYVAFFEAALWQLRPGGVCAFICADRWMLNQYGSELRRLITRHYAVEAVIEMHHADAFEFDVSAYPAITVIRRDSQGPVAVAAADPAAGLVGSGLLASSVRAVRSRADTPPLPEGLNAARVETWFQGADPWPCVSPERLAVLRRLEQEFLPLESADTATRVGIGVATGLDDVFITTNPRVVEPSRLLPLAMAGDTVDGTFQWSGHYLVDPWLTHGLVDLAEFPRLSAYFERHQARLRKRNVGQRNPKQWYRTIDRVNHALTKEPKLYIPDIKDAIGGSTVLAGSSGTKTEAGRIWKDRCRNARGGDWWWPDARSRRTGDRYSGGRRPRTGSRTYENGA